MNRNFDYLKPDSIFAQPKNNKRNSRKRYYSKADTGYAGKKMEYLDLIDYAGIKLYLKRKFPQYFSNMIFDYAAEIPKELQKQCVKDTYMTFEELNIPHKIRAEFMGVDMKTYKALLVKAEIITANDDLFSTDAKKFMIFDSIKNGLSSAEICAKHTIVKSTARRYIDAFNSQGNGVYKSENKYNMFYKQWLESQKGNQNVIQD